MSFSKEAKEGMLIGGGVGLLTGGIIGMPAGVLVGGVIGGMMHHDDGQDVAPLPTPSCGSCRSGGMGGPG